MNRGKAKCDKLKKIRRAIAKANHIEYEPEECTFEGNCDGTCPRCDAELEDLNKILAEKESRGEKISIPSIEMEPEKTDEVYEQTDHSTVWGFLYKNFLSWLKNLRPEFPLSGIPNYSEEEEQKCNEENSDNKNRHYDLIIGGSKEKEIYEHEEDDDEDEAPLSVLRGKVSSRDNPYISLIEQFMEKYANRQRKAKDDSDIEEDNLD